MSSTSQLTQWTEIPYPKLQNSFGHTSALFKDYMITFGGRSETWRFDFHGISILNLKTNSLQKFKFEGEKPKARCRHSACLFDSNKILIFGGFSKEGIMGYPIMISIEETSRYNSSFQKIDTELNLAWKEIKTTGGKDLARYGHSADVYKNKMYVFGGRHQEKPRKMNNNELWVLNLDSFCWEYCTTKGEKPRERTAHSSMIHEGKLYIFGGFCDATKQALRDCYAISLETMEWKKLAIKGVDFVPRFGASCAISNENIYIIGGGPDLSGQNQVLCYNTKNNRLKYVNSNGKYAPVNFASAVQYKNSLVLWGGLVNNGKSLAEIKRLQLDSQVSKSVCSLEIAHLLESEQHSDVKFLIEGQIIPAHKLVLALKCKYFSGLFSSGMKESYSQVIEITDVKLETFKAFLKFLYENEIEIMTEALALDLYILADKYMQKELMTFCEEFIAENFNLGTLEAMIDFPEHFGSAKFFKKKKRTPEKLI